MRKKKLMNTADKNIAYHVTDYHQTVMFHMNKRNTTERLNHIATFS